MLEAKSSRRRQLRRECLGSQRPSPALTTDQRMRKIDTDIEIESVTWRDLVFGVAVFMNEWRPDGEIVRFATVRRNSRLHQRRKKRQRASIGNWWFRAIELDVQIINERARHSREYVLHSVQRIFALSKLRAAFREHRDVGGGGKSLAAAIGADKRDTGSA